MGDILHTVKVVVGCLFFALLGAGCVQEEIDTYPTTGGGDPAKYTSYVSLSFSSPQGVFTRSNPTGGETGDGQEKGQDKENEITSAVVFFYQGNSGDGVNSYGATPIQAAVSFNVTNYTEPGNGIDRKYITESRQVDLENGTYNLLVVVNPGEDWWTGRTLTLDDVRDYIHVKAWNESGSGGSNDYSNFVMTSEADTRLTLESNTEDDPAIAEVSVERMAARLDYKALGTYTCDDSAYASNGKKATVEITGAALINNLTAGSYLIKRIAQDVNGTGLSYLGRETSDAGVQTNYVLDPWTVDKTSTNDDFTVGGETKHAEDLYGLWFGNCSQNPNDWETYVTQGTAVSDGTETWWRIGYTLENTTAAAEAGSRYSTGVVFKAKFHPVDVPNYTDGSTFFALSSHLFASMEEMMSYVYGAAFSKFDERIDRCTGWSDLKSFAASLLDNDPSGYKTFLQRQDETQDFASVQESLKWRTYMETECGYSAERGEDGNYVVSLDQNSLQSTREALRPYGTRTYENATCYYTWWVRHSNDNNDNSKGIMEYAIVRNNIYKLTVSSVYSLGDEIPGEKSLIVDVYVNDWLLLDNETLPM